MSWFADTNVDDIPDNPNELPNNTYKFQVISAKLGETANKTKTGITFKYQIVEGPWSTFFPITDWVQVPDGNVGTKEEKQRMLSYLKMRLLAWGFTTEEIQGFGPGDEMKCINRTFYGTTAIRNGKDSNGNDQKQIRVQKFDPIGDGMVDFPDDDGVI